MMILRFESIKKYMGLKKFGIARLRIDKFVTPYVHKHKAQKLQGKSVAENLIIL